MNKYLSKNLIFDISLSEEHCAAMDYNNCMYTWGLGINGELGFFDKNEKITTIPIKVMYNNKPFLVEKIKCGKHYTAGITNDGIPFVFGNKNIDNDINNNIIFFSLENNFRYINKMAKDVYCGENYILILLETERLLIYDFNEGLFEILINKGNYNTITNKVVISKVNVLGKNFYILDEKNKKLYEFIYQPKNYSKLLNIKDFYLNDYEINKDLKLSIIEMPFFVKFLFFWIECSENQKKNFISQKDILFQKASDCEINCFKKNKGSKGPYINESILFRNNKKRIEFGKIEYENIYKRNKIKTFSKENSIKNCNKSKNNKLNFLDEKNETLDSTEEYLNLPISKNYGNKNDVEELKKKNANFDNINSNSKYNTINNEKGFNKVTNKINSKRFLSTDENRKKYSVSLDKNKTRRTIDEYEKLNETLSKNNKISNKRKNSNSFLIQNKTYFNNTNENDNDKYTYIHIQFKKNKKRSISQKKDKSNKFNSRTINNEEENEFDSILRNINNRKLMRNHPIKLEDQVPSTKKILSQIGRTKSKTEMLIKELHETFFGKEKKKQNIYNNYLNNNINNNNISEEETKNENKTDICKQNNEEKKIFSTYNNKEKAEMKVTNNFRSNNIDDENEKNEIFLDYNKKKEAEIDINKILGYEKNKEKELIKNEKKKENEKLINENKKLNIALKLEKEKLEKELEEIKEKKEEYILKEKLMEENKEEIKKEKEIFEKEMREKIENEYKEKYEKEIKDNLEQKKNFIITSEINKFTIGHGSNIEKIKENINNNRKNNNKFMPESLKTENESEFIMKGINKKNYNLTISNNQQINIENHLHQDKHNNKAQKQKDIINNNNNDFNLHIEDITSTRDLLFENNNIINNIPSKIDSLISPISPQLLNESKEISKNDTNREEEIMQQQSIILTDLLQKNNKTTNKNEENNEDEKENSLKFLIEDNNIKSQLNTDKNKEKGDSFEMTNISEEKKEDESKINNFIEVQENEENEPEKVLEFDNSKKKLNLNWKEKSKTKNHINEVIEEKQELESLEDTCKSKNKTKSVCLPNNNSNIQAEKSLIPMPEVSNSNMRHISTFDQNIISSIRKFEPKELDDITGSLRFFSNRSENIIPSFANKTNNKTTSERIDNIIYINSTNNSNLKLNIGFEEKSKNIYDLNNMNYSKNNNLILESNKKNEKELNLNSNINEKLKDKKMKIDDLEQSKLLSEKNDDSVDKIQLNNQMSEVRNKLFEPHKIIKLKNKEELGNALFEINKEEKSSTNNSLYFLLENDSPQEVNINNEKDIYIFKVKNKKMTELNSGNNLIFDNKSNKNKTKMFNNKLKFLRNYNLMNQDLNQNYHTFSEKQNINENNFQRNQTNIEENKISKNKNIIRGIQFKKIGRNKSFGKQNNKKLKKKIGIIEQIKKEQYEKKQQIIYNTFNNRNKIILTNNNITPFINIKQQKYSKNSIANIGYNNMFHYDPRMIPININMNMNIMHEQNNIKNNKENKMYNNKKEEISNIKLNNNKTKEKKNESFIILRKKYLDFLIKVYGNENIPKNKENEKLDNTFLEGLINNEVPIEDINLNLLKCSKDMKNFIGESLENFKLQQIKEKMPKINDSNFLYLNTNNNEKMQLEYDDDIKDKSNILEPIELDKSNNYNLNFRKSFVESLSGIKSENKFLKLENISNK